MNSVLQKRFQGRQGAVLICLLLAAATFAAYFGVGSCEFVNFDDYYMISVNAWVHAGLTLKSVYWGLTTTFYEYWHPLTWWSHMLDWHLFGANAGGHHWTSLVLHVFSTLLLFAVLERMTSRLWPSAIVAALFGLHPLHVESVAWLAERKDVLSALFMLLSLWYYVRYAEETRPVGEEADRSERGTLGSRARLYFCLSLLFFAFGLMSKPMVVTLPCVLLLLDYWPPARNAECGVLSAESGKKYARWRGLLVEKVPFFALALASCVITYLGVRSADNILKAEQLPWGLRLANIPISYVRYLWKTVYPVDFAVLYPMPPHWAAGQVVGSMVLLAAITVVVWALRRSAPFLIFGWLLFLGVLFPTIGVVPVGIQSIADRYMYLPSIGLFVAGVWAGAELSQRWKLPTIVTGGATVAMLALLGCLTWAQCGHWRNSVSLWTHCLKAGSESYSAHYNLASAYAGLGQTDAAIEELHSALKLDPTNVDCRFYLGVVLAASQHPEAANNAFAEVLRMKPGHIKARVNLALALMDLGDTARALVECDRAIQTDPKSGSAYVGRGRILSAQGRSEEAVKAFQAALALKAEDYDAQYYLGVEWLKIGRLADAIIASRRSAELNPTNPLAHYQLALALSAAREGSEAASEYRTALRLRPDWPEALNNLAWILATSADGTLRNGREAARLASRACELTESKQTRFLGTLATAYAEAGEFDKAVELAQKTCDLAAARGEATLAKDTQVLLELFRNHRPYHEGK